MGVDAWALVFAIVSIVWSFFVWFSARREARDARRDAGRALSAAEESAQAAKRSADAAEEQLALARPAAIAFEIRHGGKGQFRLHNTGTQRVSEVRILRPETGLLDDEPIDETLEPGQSVHFRMLGSWGSPIPGSLQVTCAELPESVFVAVPES